MENEYLEETRYLRAQKRVKEIKGFYWNLFWYMAVNIIWLLILFYFNQEESLFKYGFFGMGYGLIANVTFWGIGLFFHWFIVFGRGFAFSRKWEERKLKEYMKNDKL